MSFDPNALGPPGARVTRNNPPKLIRVNDDAMLVLGDKTFAGDAYPLPEGVESDGTEVLVPGPMAEQLEADGHVTILEWDATEDFNKDDAVPEKYEQADDHGQFSDVTSHRQHLGAEHVALGREMTEEEA